LAAASPVAVLVVIAVEGLQSVRKHEAADLLAFFDPSSTAERK
jgi:hypothetical protein